MPITTSRLLLAVLFAGAAFPLAGNASIIAEASFENSPIGRINDPESLNSGSVGGTWSLEDTINSQIKQIGSNKLLYADHGLYGLTFNLSKPIKLGRPMQVSFSSGGARNGFTSPNEIRLLDDRGRPQVRMRLYRAVAKKESKLVVFDTNVRQWTVVVDLPNYNGDGGAPKPDDLDNIEIHLDQNGFQIFLNDKAVTETMPFERKGSSLAAIAFHGGGSNSGAHYDNIVVK